MKLRFLANFLILFALLCNLMCVAQSKAWSLQECIDYAFSNNLQIQQAQLNNELTETQIEQAKNQKLPTIGAYLNNQLLLGRSNVPVTNSSQIIALNSTNYQRYSLVTGISSNVTVYQGGFLKLNQEKAAKDFESNVYQTEDLKNDIALNVVNAYLTVLLNKELESVAKEQLKVSENQVDLNQKLYSGGAIPLSNLYEVKAQLAQDQQRYENAKISVQQALFDMSLLLQLPNYLDFDIDDIRLEGEPSLGLYDLDEIISYALQNQPQSISAQKQLESAELDIQLAKTAYQPTIRASLGIDTNYNDFLNRRNDDAFLRQLNDNVTQSLGLNISIPIFNQFLTDLSVEQAKIGTALAKKNIEIQNQGLTQEIQTAYFNAHAQHQQYQAAKEAVRSAELSFDFANRSFKAGQITVYDYNLSANNLFAAKSQLLQAKYNFIFRLKVLDFYAGKPLKF